MQYLHIVTQVVKSCCHGYQAVLRVLEARRRRAGASALDQVKLKGDVPEVVTVLVKYHSP